MPSTLPAARPPLVNVEADSKIPLRVWANWIPVHGHRPLVRALTEDEHSIVARRARELDEGLKPFQEGEKDRVRAALHAMLGGFRSLKARDENAEASVEVLLCVLRDFPAWAIDAAAMRIAKREAGLDPRWPPNDAEIHAVVSAVVEPYIGVRDRLQSLLAAPVEKPQPIERPQPQHDWHVFKWRQYQFVGDGKHAARVLAELAERKARNDQRTATGPPAAA